MKVDYDKIRELLEKAECVEHFYIKGEEFSILERRLYQKAISLLPKPCEKVFNCKHFKEYSQSVPMPFGSGSCSEPLGDCAIESESEDCTLECPDYKEAGCRPEQQLNKPGEFVKEARKMSKALEPRSGGYPCLPELEQACTYLEALLKQIKGLEGEKKRLEEENAGLLKLTELLDEHPEGYDGPCLCKLCMSYG